MHRNWCHSSLVEDGQYGNGLQLENIAQFFQVTSEYFGKIAKNGYSLIILSRRSHFIFSSQCCKSNFMIEKRFLVI